MFTQKLTVRFAEVRDTIEDIAPQVKVITLVDDVPILADGQLCATVKRGAGILVELHRHRPLHEDGTALLDDRVDIHV